MKILNIIESAYRGTVEEQDDTILWLTHSMCAAGASIDVLLRGNAVNYAIAQQHAEPMMFGKWTQQHPPDAVGQLGSLMDAGVKVHACAADITDRGILKERVMNRVSLVTHAEITLLLETYDRILAW